MIEAPSTRTRVLVLAPTGRDAPAAIEQLEAAGLGAVACASMTELIGKLDEGAGVAVIAEEAFRTGLADLTRWVQRQPPWSDFPFLVLTGQRIYRKEDALRLRLIEALGN